jgi:hypothetical protein
MIYIVITDHGVIPGRDYPQQVPVDTTTANPTTGSPPHLFGLDVSDNEGKDVCLIRLID